MPDQPQLPATPGGETADVPPQISPGGETVAVPPAPPPDAPGAGGTMALPPSPAGHGPLIDVEKEVAGIQEAIRGGLADRPTFAEAVAQARAQEQAAAAAQAAYEAQLDRELQGWKDLLRQARREGIPLDEGYGPGVIDGFLRRDLSQLTLEQKVQLTKALRAHAFWAAEPLAETTQPELVTEEIDAVRDSVQMLRDHGIQVTPVETPEQVAALRPAELPSLADDLVRDFRSQVEDLLAEGRLLTPHDAQVQLVAKAINAGKWHETHPGEVDPTYDATVTELRTEYAKPEFRDKLEHGLVSTDEEIIAVAGAEDRALIRKMVGVSTPEDDALVARSFESEPRIPTDPALQQELGRLVTERTPPRQLTPAEEAALAKAGEGALPDQDVGTVRGAADRTDVLTRFNPPPAAEGFDPLFVPLGDEPPPAPALGPGGTVIEPAIDFPEPVPEPAPPATTPTGTEIGAPRPRVEEPVATEPTSTEGGTPRPPVEEPVATGPTGTEVGTPRPQAEPAAGGGVATGPTGTEVSTPPPQAEPAPTGTAPGGGTPTVTGTEPAPTGTAPGGGTPTVTGTEPAPTGTPPTGGTPTPTGTEPAPTGTMPTPTGTEPAAPPAEPTAPIRESVLPQGEPAAGGATSGRPSGLVEPQFGARPGVSGQIPIPDTPLPVSVTPPDAPTGVSDLPDTPPTLPDPSTAPQAVAPPAPVPKVEAAVPPQVKVDVVPPAPPPEPPAPPAPPATPATPAQPEGAGGQAEPGGTSTPSGGGSGGGSSEGGGGGGTAVIPKSEPEGGTPKQEPKGTGEPEGKGTTGGERTKTGEPKAGTGEGEGKGEGAAKPKAEPESKPTGPVVVEPIKNPGAVLETEAIARLKDAGLTDINVVRTPEGNIRITARTAEGAPIDVVFDKASLQKGTPGSRAIAGLSEAVAGGLHLLMFALLVKDVYNTVLELKDPETVYRLLDKLAQVFYDAAAGDSWGALIDFFGELNKLAGPLPALTTLGPAFLFLLQVSGAEVLSHYLDRAPGLRGLAWKIFDWVEIQRAQRDGRAPDLWNPPQPPPKQPTGASTKPKPTATAKPKGDTRSNEEIWDALEENRRWQLLYARSILDANHLLDKWRAELAALDPDDPANAGRIAELKSWIDITVRFLAMDQAKFDYFKGLIAQDEAALRGRGQPVVRPTMPPKKTPAGKPAPVATGGGAAAKPAQQAAQDGVKVTAPEASTGNGAKPSATGGGTATPAPPPPPPPGGANVPAPPKPATPAPSASGAGAPAAPDSSALRTSLGDLAATPRPKPPPPAPTGGGAPSPDPPPPPPPPAPPDAPPEPPTPPAGGPTATRGKVVAGTAAAVVGLGLGLLGGSASISGGGTTGVQQPSAPVSLIGVTATPPPSEAPSGGTLPGSSTGPTIGTPPLITAVSAVANSQHTLTMYTAHTSGSTPLRFTWGWARNPGCGQLQTDSHDQVSFASLVDCPPTLEATASIVVCAQNPLGVSVATRSARYGDENGQTDPQLVAAGLTSEGFTQRNGVGDCAAIVASGGELAPRPPPAASAAAAPLLASVVGADTPVQDTVAAASGGGNTAVNTAGLAAGTVLVSGGVITVVLRRKPRKDFVNKCTEKDCGGCPRSEHCGTWLGYARQAKANADRAIGDCEDRLRDARQAAADAHQYTLQVQACINQLEWVIPQQEAYISALNQYISGLQQAMSMDEQLLSLHGIPAQDLSSSAKPGWVEVTPNLFAKDAHTANLARAAGGVDSTAVTLDWAAKNNLLIAALNQRDDAKDNLDEWQSQLDDLRDHTKPEADDLDEKAQAALARAEADLKDAEDADWNAQQELDRWEKRNQDCQATLLSEIKAWAQEEAAAAGDS